jgi:hypothetical protein
MRNIIKKKKMFTFPGCILSREGTNTNIKFFGLTQLEIEPMIYHTPGNHDIHYTTDAAPSSNYTTSLKSFPVFYLQYDKQRCHLNCVTIIYILV